MPEDILLGKHIIFFALISLNISIISSVEIVVLLPRSNTCLHPSSFKVSINPSPCVIAKKAISSAFSLHSTVFILISINSPYFWDVLTTTPGLSVATIASIILSILSNLIKLPRSNNSSLSKLIFF